MHSPARLPIDRLAACWQRLYHRPPPAGLGAELSRRYAEPHRHYHTAHHIRHLLSEFDAVKTRIQNPDRVELAIWAHDVIYDIGATDNERRSADWLLAQLPATAPPEHAARLETLIMATVHIDIPEPQGDTCWLIDLDLASLSLSWAHFVTDSRHLYQETLSAFPDTAPQTFSANQQRFLGALFQRDQLYWTDHFRATRETQARDNFRRLQANGAAILR